MIFDILRLIPESLIKANGNYFTVKAELLQSMHFSKLVELSGTQINTYTLIGFQYVQEGEVGRGDQVTLLLEKNK